MSTPEAAIDNNEQSKDVEYVDINDPQFMDAEIDGFDDSKDPLAFTIVRDGIYDVEVDFADQDVGKRWANRSGDSGKYLSTRIAARILDGQFANRIVYDGFVSTMVFDGTTGVAKVIAAVGGKVAGARADGEQARRLTQLLPARTKVKVQVQAREEGVKKPFKKGERQFPQKPDGTPDFEAVMNSEGPEHGGQVFVESRIVKYIRSE